ncbi:MAG TPA: hypothetical protein VFG18_10745 [Xanthomonadaceae bacterium]|jgi:hypothetical protein|nr:hypothetical protein [Xanthomonadaceae bacterium]
MGTNQHARDRNRSGDETPPPGPDRFDDGSHALRAGAKGTSPRHSKVERESPTREEGRDDHRSGSDSNR